MLFTLALAFLLQTAPAPTKHVPPQPAATAAPGGGPGKVWLNDATGVYHCFGDRYYGKTKQGRYLPEADARKLGAHGPRNKPCPAH